VGLETHRPAEMGESDWTAASDEEKIKFKH